MNTPPAGGFGGAPPAGWGPQGPPPQNQGSGGTAALIVVIVVLVLVVGGGMLAVLGIYGVRKYIAGAKTSEAIVTLGRIGKDAVVAYESEPLEGSWATSATGPNTGRPKRGLCRSAQPVPLNISEVSAKKYMSTPDDWTSWGCLSFRLDAPQYYQYRYDNTGDGFSAVAQGDLDGNGVTSKFELIGKVRNDELTLAPQVLQTNPEE